MSQAAKIFLGIAIGAIVGLVLSAVLVIAIEPYNWWTINFPGSSIFWSIWMNPSIATLMGIVLGGIVGGFFGALIHTKKE